MSVVNLIFYPPIMYPLRKHIASLLDDTTSGPCACLAREIPPDPIDSLGSGNYFYLYQFL
jgi:hypothetical protein